MAVTASPIGPNIANHVRDPNYFILFPANMDPSVTLTTTVLGKRSRNKVHVGVIHLPSSCSEHSDLEPVASTSQAKPVLINGRLVANTKKRYRCTFAGCDKAYTKPSRLEEHERSHTGEVSGFVLCLEPEPIPLCRGRSFARPAKSHISEKPISRHTCEAISRNLHVPWLAITMAVASASGPLSI